jgi:ADP-ribose pyrophosphatase YjhB (NUDIX family)
LKSILARLFRLLPLALTRAAVGLAHTRFNISVVGVFFDAAGRVLVLRHVYRKYHAWGLPAGFLMPGETPEIAAVREVKEETGLDVIVTATLFVHPVRPRHMEVVVVGLADGRQTIRPSAEIFEGCFVAPDALPPEMMPSQAALVHLARKPGPVLSTQA